MLSMYVDFIYDSGSLQSLLQHSVLLRKDYGYYLHEPRALSEE